MAAEPALAISASFTPFNSSVGSPSGEQHYTLSASYLTGDLTINAPADFEISTTSGSGFGAALTLHAAGGMVANTTIYVRFNRPTAGSAEGNIVHTADGLVPQTVAVSGTAVSGWTAYNDCAGGSDGDVTNFTIESGSTTGYLKNYYNGASTPVTVTISTHNSPSIQTGDYGGTETAEGTDAYNTFHDFVDIVGVTQYGSSTGWYIDLTFTGLDPAKTYTFATSANRAGTSSTTPPYSDRITKFTLSDDDGASNASTPGTTISADSHSVSFVTGNNTTAGYVARWSGIQPGADGDFTVRAEANNADSTRQAYGPSVFMLQEDEDTLPAIAISGTLAAFSSEPGVESEEQHFTVSGNNLTDDITVTAPDDFEISTTSGSGFSSLLSLTPTDGVVSDTTIYVRFIREEFWSFQWNH